MTKNFAALKKLMTEPSMLEIPDAEYLRRYNAYPKLVAILKSVYEGGSMWGEMESLLEELGEI